MGFDNQSTITRALGDHRGGHLERANTFDKTHLIEVTSKFGQAVGVDAAQVADLRARRGR